MNIIGIIVTAIVMWAFYYWGYRQGLKQGKIEGNRFEKWDNKNHSNDGAE